VEVIEPVVENALRYTPVAGSIDVDFRLAPSGDDLVVTVSNTGGPIPPDIAPHVFDAWVSSRDASVAGGLGLWLARETARDLGGEVELVPGGTDVTTFRVRLPSARS
jgi:signal transduction histidine kinase